MHGLESLSSAFGPGVQDAEVARMTEREELKKAKAEATDAQGRAALTIMSSITAAEGKRDNAATEAERDMYQAIITTLRQMLTDSL